MLFYTVQVVACKSNWDALVHFLHFQRSTRWLRRTALTLFSRSATPAALARGLRSPGNQESIPEGGNNGAMPTAGSEATRSQLSASTWEGEMSF